MPGDTDQSDQSVSGQHRWYSDSCMEAYWALWGSGSGIFGTLLGGLLIGTPLAMLAADRNVGEAAVWGLVWGCLLYGTLLMACMVGFVLALPVDITRWTIHRLRRGRG